MATYDAIVRVSRVGYRDATLDSDREQERQVRAWASQHGHNIAVVHIERDVSGKTTNRKALRAAKARALDGTVDGVVAAYVSRFSRNTKEGLELVTDLLDAGREFVALDCAGMDLRSPAGEQFLTMLLSQARAEWRTRQDTFNLYRAKAIKRGVHLQERFGYRKGADGRLVADPVEAPWVPRIFERRAAGASWTQLADWLNAEGVKPHAFSARKDGAASKRTRGTHWNHARVKSLVESRTYLGEAKSGEHVTPDAHPALVSVQVFNRCAALRDLRPRRGAAEYELSGIARCAGCGGRMRGTTDRGYRYYRCASHNVCAITRKIRADVLEPAVAEVFADVARGMRAVRVESGNTLDAAMVHLADMEALRDDVAADLDLMRASRPAYIAAVAEAEDRVTRARDAVRVTRTRVTGVSASDHDLDNWSALGVDTRRRFLAEAFDAVYVAPDRAGWAPVGRGELADFEHVSRDFLTIA